MLLAQLFGDFTISSTVLVVIFTLAFTSSFAAAATTTFVTTFATTSFLAISGTVIAGVVVTFVVIVARTTCSIASSWAPMFFAAFASLSRVTFLASSASLASLFCARSLTGPACRFVIDVIIVVRVVIINNFNLFALFLQLGKQAIDRLLNLAPLLMRHVRLGVLLLHAENCGVHLLD